VPAASAVVTREHAEAILLRHDVPDGIAGTRAAGPSRRWCNGVERDLRHDHWRICTGDPALERSWGAIHFDSVMDLGGVTLDSEPLAHDHLTKKLLVLSWLTGTASRQGSCGRQWRAMAESYDWVVRHRLSIGVVRFRDVKPSDMEDLLTRARSGPIAGVVPVVERIVAAALPIPPDHDSHVATATDVASAPALDGQGATAQFALNRIATQIGVTPQSIVSMPAAIAALRSAFGGAAATRAERGRATQDDADRMIDTGARRGRAMADLLRVLDDLAGLGKRGVLDHDPLPFNPVRDFAGRYAQDGDEQDGATALRRKPPGPRAEAVSAVNLLRWLDAAATWILQYSGAVLRAYDHLRLDPALDPSIKTSISAARRLELQPALDAELPPGMPRIALTWRASKVGADPRLHGRLPVTEVVHLLVTACQILITAFGACSVDEFVQLMAGCVTEPSPGLFMFATARDPALRAFSEVPVNALFRRAVRVLESLTAETRALEGDNRLSRLVMGGSACSPERPQHMVPLPRSGGLRLFAQFNGLPLVDPASGTRMSGDQFRKGMTVALVHVVPGATVDEACSFARLSAPDTARDYVYRGLPGRMAELQAEIATRVSDARAAAPADDPGWLRERRALLAQLKTRETEFGAVRSAAFVERLLGVEDGTDVPGGRGGARLVGDVAKLRAAARSDIRIGSRNDPDASRIPLLEQFWRYAERNTCDAITGGFAHCGCRPNSPDLAAARCLLRRAATRSPWTQDGEQPAETHADFAYAGMETCFGSERDRSDGADDGGCPFALAFAGNRKVLGGTVAGLAEGAAKAATPASRSIAEGVVRRIRAVVLSAEPKGGTSS